MDDDLSQSSRPSQQAELDESRHRGLASRVTLKYDSDSELQVNDTLRMEDSDEESPTPSKDAMVTTGLPSAEPGNSPEATLEDDTRNNSETGEEITGAKDRKIAGRKKFSQLIDSDSEEEQPIRKVNEGPDEVPQASRFSNIFDSDSDVDTGPKIAKEDSDSDSDSDSARLRKQNDEVDHIGEKIERSMNRLKSLIDSESATPEEESSEQMKKKKKLKSKKEREKSRINKNPKDLLASLNLDFSDESSRSRGGSVSRSDEENCTRSDASGSDQEGSSKKRNKARKHAEDKPQRMSARAAMEQMKVIQSESQRMAREASVTVPYHRPKQHTLQEFLNRRTVFKSVLSSSGGIADGQKKIAAAIKMNPEQLAAYAKQLEEREKEALEFFKSESDEEAKKCENDTTTVDVNSATTSQPVVDINSESTATQTGDQAVNTNSEMTDMLTDHAASTGDILIEEPTETQKDISCADANVPVEEEPTALIDSAQKTSNTELFETLRMSDTEIDPLDELVNKTHENIEQILASQTIAEEPSSSEPVKANPVIDYDIFPDPKPSTFAQKKAELLSVASVPLVPTLKGSPNMVIDLDSGDLKPKGPTGAEILFQRFAKCSGKKVKKPAQFSILSTDKGVLEMDSISLSLEQEERDPNGKEPVPGAAFMKLKQSLREKMERARREALRKRQEETEQASKLDDDEDEDDEEELLENNEELDKINDEEIEQEEDTPEKQGSEFIEAEADEICDEENDGNNYLEQEDEESESESSDDSDEESAHVPLVEGKKKKSRIIAAFEDSDDETTKDKNAETDDNGVLHKQGTEELFSTLKDTDKFTNSDRNNIETGESIKLFWKNSEDAAISTQADDDLMALCSGRFGDTQTVAEEKEFPCATQATSATQSGFAFPNSEKNDMDSLFTQRTEQQTDDSELIALCSGTFATQRMPQAETQQQDADPPQEFIAKGKLVIASSDEEEKIDEGTNKRKRKRKRRHINISDDEEDEEEEASDADQESELDDYAEAVVDEEEEAEHFVDYDSEENEVEVVMTKKDKKVVANAFLEKEAELSESEWGSADEDEKDLDRYDIELGDEENFDQHKLQEELERIHTRRMLEQDKKEVKTLQDIFFEDEEKDGVGRERQFRWRNVETTFNLDYDKKPEEDNRDGEGGSDDENELQWRKMRHERELLLKEKKIDLDEVNLSTTLLDKTVAEEENNSSVGNVTTSLIAKKRITIIRSKNSSEANTSKDSPFLITKSSIVQGHKASFLSRDEETLNKLASLVKVNPETEGANTVIAGKGRNFVFASVSPAIDKTGAKRSLDTECDNPAQSAKKAKTVESVIKADGKTKKRLLLGHLM